MNLNFDKLSGLVPAVIQDATSGKVLMLGFMNADAFDRTVSTGKVTFFSRSKNRLWTKGETSGNFLEVVSISSDCDNDSLLIQVDATGPTCHTGSRSCFTNTGDFGFLYELERIILNRSIGENDGSYVKSLLEKGINKVAQKVGEEAVELVIEAKDDNAGLFGNEAADLLFHFLVLLRAKKTSLSTIESVLRIRNNPNPSEF